MFAPLLVFLAAMNSISFTTDHACSVRLSFAGLGDCQASVEIQLRVEHDRALGCNNSTLRNQGSALLFTSVPLA